MDLRNQPRSGGVGGFQGEKGNGVEKGQVFSVTPSWVLLNGFFFSFSRFFYFVRMLACENLDRDVLKLLQMPERWGLR